MLVKKIYDASDLMEEFKSMNRDYFSYEGYQALIDMFDEYPEPVELDVIAICCEFNEQSPEGICLDYNCIDVSDLLAEGADDETIQEAVTDQLNEHTFAVALSNGNILYQEF